MDLKLIAPLVIGAMAFGAIALLILGVAQWLSGAKGPARERLEAYTAATATGAAGEVDSTVMRDRRLSRFGALNRFLAESPYAQGMAVELAQARIPLKVGEYMLVRVMLAGFTGYTLWVLGGSVLAVAPGIVMGYFAPRFYVGHRRRSRIKEMETQLVDALSLTANSLRAGWGFNQAMAQIATELPPPISEEFTEVLQEISIGVTPEAAIHNMVQRVGSYDMELVMTGVLIQRQTGGNLAEMLDKTVSTVRERIKLLGDIDSIVAESRMSMWLLCLLPVFLLVFLSVSMPHYMLPFLEDPRGRLMLLAGGVFEILGVVVMKKIAAIEV